MKKIFDFKIGKRKFGIYNEWNGSIFNSNIVFVEYYT